MSQLEVDKIIPQSGTTLTIGDSGDTITFADGAVIGIDTDTLYIDSANNRVGIGTSSPATALEISNNSPRIRLTDANYSTGSQVEIQGDNGNIFINADQTGLNSNRLIAFQLNNSEAMRITSSGNVGIGTTSPNQKLEIFTDGSSSANPVINLRMNQGNSANGDNQAITFDFKPYSYSYYNRAASIGYVTENDWTSLSSNGWDGRLTFNVSTITNIGSADTLPTERMCINEVGNVGIGTSSPTSLVHASVPSGSQSQIRASNTGNTGIFIFSGDSSAGLWNDDNTPTLFATNSTERMRIDSSGNVLVGTTTRKNNAKLQVDDLSINPTDIGVQAFQLDVSKYAINQLSDGVAYNLFEAKGHSGAGYGDFFSFAGQLFLSVGFIDSGGGTRTYQQVYDISVGRTMANNITWNSSLSNTFTVQNGGASSNSVSLSAVSVSSTSAKLAMTVTTGTYSVSSSNNSVCVRLVGTAFQKNVDEEFEIIRA